MTIGCLTLAPRRLRPQFCNQPQNLLKHSSRDCELGHLEEVDPGIKLARMLPEANVASSQGLIPVCMPNVPTMSEAFEGRIS